MSAGRPAIPVRARHVEYSAILSADDDPGRPSDRLLDLSLLAVAQARRVSMEHVVKRMAGPPYYPNVWPGEHYKLLGGLVGVMKPKVVIEIGTFTGLSSLAMLPFLVPDALLVTFDVVPWEMIPGTALRTTDFVPSRFHQLIGDVSDPAMMKSHANLFRSADFIFIDGPKDSKFERVLLDRLVETGLPKKPVLMFDDIRLWDMLAIWRGIGLPKLDLTSFGHWSGTGLVDWQL